MVRANKDCPAQPYEEARTPSISALETRDTNLLTKISEDSDARGFKTSSGIWDREGRGEREVGDDATPLVKRFPFLVADDGDEANKLTESRCKSGGLVEERGRGLGAPILDRDPALATNGLLFEGGGVDCCDKVKRERERGGVAESAVVGRRANERCEARKCGSVAEGRTLVLSGGTGIGGKLGVFVRAIDGWRMARSEWRLESLALLELLRDLASEPGGSVKSTRSGELGFNTGSEGDTGGTVRCCGDDVENLRDQNDDFRTRGVEGEFSLAGEVEARFGVVNICVIETPLVRCCSFDKGCSGRNEYVLLLFRRAFSALLFGKDVNATEFV